MKTLSILVVLSFLSSSTNMISFKNEADVANWSVTSDGVMGGLSKGSIKASDNGVIFSGEVSLKNFGGFTSYKSPFGEHDLSQFEKLSIRYRSTGHDMGFQIETSQQFFLPYFKANLPVSEEWTTVTINFDAFQQYQMGDKTGNTLTSQDLKEVARIGFITNEKKEGAFSFEVEHVKFL
ncbi:MAG: CIA30 family protein [Bacteroidota bacterium]